MTWKNFADLLTELSRLRLQEWQCGLPAHDTLPSEVLDVAVSAWCEELLRDPTADMEPPADVRPWLLARIAVAASIARHCETSGENPPEGSPRDTMRQLLISEWHGAARDRWPLLMQLPEED